MSATEHPRANWRPRGERTATKPAVPARPRHASQTRATPGAKRSPWWLELIAIAWLAVIYDRLTAAAPVRLHEAIGHGAGILRLEQALHLDPELSLNHWLAGQHTLGVILSYYYDNAHFVVTLGLLAYIWWARADIYRPLRNSLVLINVIGFAVFWRYPVAPPRLLPGTGYIDVVANSHTFGSWHTGKLASTADQLAAMPSLHLAWACWSSLVLWRISNRWWVRALAVAYPIITSVGVMTTGNHYLADVLAGVVTMVVSVLAVEVAAPRVWRALRGARDPVPQT
jgi:hypothetical protein